MVGTSIVFLRACYESCQTRIVRKGGLHVMSFLKKWAKPGIFLFIFVIFT